MSIDAVKDLIGEDAKKYCTPVSNKESTNDKFMLDLKGVVIFRFTMLGIKEENIDQVGSCTMCHPERYYSHRGTKGNRGSLASVICMNSR